MPIKKKKREEDEDEEIMIQGEEYNGEDDDDIDADEDEDKGATLNKNVIIIVAIVLVVIGIVVVVATTMLKNKEKANDSVDGAASKYENYVDDQDTSEIDAILAQEGLLDDSTITEIDSGYTETDKSSLRGAGYTGPEIEQFEKDGKLVDDLLLKAKVEKDRFLQQRYKELDIEARKTEASDAYKELRDYTWLCGEPQELVYDETESYTTEIERYNARYEKIPLRGNACMIKLYLDEDKGYSPAFYNVHPERYSQLKDSGNMVVTYDVVTYNGGKYICNISEVTID